MIGEGRYTLLYPNGEYRTLRIKMWKKTKQRVLGLREKGQGKTFTGCGTLTDTDQIKFWFKWKQNPRNTPDRIKAIETALLRIKKDPDAAGLSYAMKEGECFRCGRPLTVPASLHKGMGPECAKKNWTKDDQKQAYLWRAGQQKAPGIAQTSPVNYQSNSYTKQAAEFEKQHGGIATQQADLFTEKDQQEMDRMAVAAEKEQEARAFASDPDLGPLPDFEKEPCGICGVPRYRCSC